MIQGNREKVKGLVSASPLKVLVLIVGLYLLFVFARGIWEIRSAYLRLDEAKQQLDHEEAKRNELKQKQAEMGTQSYIEKIARNELNMQKEGELVVVLPANNTAESNLNQVADKSQGEIPNWEKWWRLVK